jgi:hypothetical protein
MVIKSNSDKVTKIDSRLFNKPNLLLIFFILTLLILCLLLILEYLEVINIIKPKKNDKNGEDITKSSEKPVSNIPIDKPVSNIPSDKPINKPIDTTNEIKTSLSVLDVLSIISLSIGGILLFYFLFKFVQGAYAFINFFKGYLIFVFTALIMITIGLVTDIPVVSNTLKNIGLVIILLISLWIFFRGPLKKAISFFFAALGLKWLYNFFASLIGGNLRDWNEVEAVEEKLKPLEKKLNKVKKNSKLSGELNKAEKKLEKNLRKANKLNQLDGEKERKNAVDIYKKEVNKEVNKEIRNELESDLYEKNFKQKSGAFVTNKIVASTIGTFALKGLINDNSSLIKKIDVKQPDMILSDEIQESNNNLDFSLSDILTSSEFGYDKNNEKFNSLKSNTESRYQGSTNLIDKIPQFQVNFKDKLDIVSGKEKVNELIKNVKEEINPTRRYTDSIEEQKKFNEDIAEVKEIYSPSNYKYSVIA